MHFGGLPVYVNIRLSIVVKKATAICIAVVLGSLMSSVFIISGNYNNIDSEIFTASADTAIKKQKLTQQNNINKDCIKLPILMYHSFLKDAKLQGTYVISPDLFEKDLKYITQNGYTTITTSQLVDYVYNGKPLPSKPIMLTFDDGYYNNYCYAFELLKKYKCKAVLSPIASVSEKFSLNEDISPSYGNCSFKNLKEMVDSGYIEIANHSYNMHSSGGRLGVGKKHGENKNTYCAIIKTDISKAQKILKENVGVDPICFTYPFGSFNSVSENVIKEMGFKISLICEEKTNYITNDKNCLYLLGRYLRNNTEQPQHLFERIEL